MNKNSLICKAIQDNDTLTILSPSIGRIELVCSLGDIVHEHQHIGFLWRLHHRFSLCLDGNSRGMIHSTLDQGRLIAVEYNKPFMTLDSKEVTEKNQVTLLHQVYEGKMVTAPMDGLFYPSPAPDEPAFVKVGDTIVPGQTIGLIEVMKSFYPVKYQGDKPVTVTDVAIKMATPVVTGATLFLVK